MIRRRAKACLIAQALLLAGSAARAGALQVSPVGLDLPPGTAAAVLTIRNDDDQPMNVQVRVFRWSQVGGQDQYDQTNDVVASPPIAPLAPHTQRLIRLVRLAPAAEVEQSYRLMVDELPPPPGAGVQKVQLLLRHSIPLFFAAPAETKAQVMWSAAPGGGGVVLTGRNIGGRHSRISDLRMLDAGGAPVASRNGLVGYVLAGAQIQWALPTSSQAAAVRLRADSDAGAVDAPIQPNP